MQFYPYNPDWLPLLELLAATPDGSTPEVTELPPGIERHPEAKRIVLYREGYLAGKKAILVQKHKARNLSKKVLGYWMDDVIIRGGAEIRCTNPAWIDLIAQTIGLERYRTHRLDAMPEGMERWAEGGTAVLQQIYYKDGWYRVVIRERRPEDDKRRERILGWFRRIDTDERPKTVKDKKHMLVAGVSCRIVKIHETTEPVVVLKEPVIVEGKNGRKYKQNLPVPVPMSQVNRLPVDVIKQPTAQEVGRCLGWKL